MDNQSWLSWFLRGVLILLFLILIAKLVEVQIIKGNYYRKLSEGNRIRHIILPAPRGKILAKNKEEMATNIPIKKRIKFLENGSILISDDLTNLKDEEIVTDYKRVYPTGSIFSHALGYLTKPGETEVGKINPKCPEKGPVGMEDLIGKSGLEEYYECELKGTPGEELIEVNTTGDWVRILGKKDPIPGNDISITLDLGLQKEVAGQMEGKNGAAIVTDATGAILAFYSYPSFDPNLFINKGDGNELTKLFNDKNLPFFNRVTSGTFHPGSVFKPLVSLAALEENAITKSFTYTDTGSITVNGFTYNNWFLTEQGRTEGTIDLPRALARSTDTFFYKIAEMTGPNAIAKWSNIFGLNKKTGIDLSSETSGLIPTTDWKKKTIGEGWWLGDTYHMGIGQGYVALTPIEINNYITAIANGGNLCNPHFNQSSTANRECKKINVKQKNFDLVKEGMIDACTEGGTAYTFFDFAAKHNGQKVACKTGTAEVGTDGTPHAWFVFFSEGPRQIIATVLVEKGGQGSSIAGPIARKIADYYFASNY